MEHQTSGRGVICPNEPAYYIVDCRISRLKTPQTILQYCSGPRYLLASAHRGLIWILQVSFFHFSTVFFFEKPLSFSGWGQFLQTFCRAKVHISKQSHYIEVPQGRGGVSRRARNNWMWTCSLFWAKKNQTLFFKRDIMQLFSADATIYIFLNQFFAYENIKKHFQKLHTLRPKFHILFHKNGSLCDFYILTLHISHV